MNSLGFTPNFNPNFTALRRAQYDCKNANGETKPITIYELEPRDLPYLNRYADTFEMSDSCAAKEDAKTKKEIMDYAFEDAIAICEQKKEGTPDFDKTHVFLAFDGDKSCGIMTSGIPKRNPDFDDNVHYSSRKGSKLNETELDWLATWSSKGGEDLFGTGKALCRELFVTSERDNFDDVFVESEIPENKSNVHQVYNQKWGFKYFGKRRKIGDSFFIPVIKRDPALLNDTIIPLQISRQDKLAVMEDMEKKQPRKELDNVSVNLDALA